MVLWEITLATAYVLGLKRTYGLALKTQRRLVSPKHPRLRQFVHRRTRAVFDVALKVHKNIQQRDIEVGHNLGNWILQWADRMRPSAQISSQQFPKLPTISLPKMNMPKQVFSTKDRIPRIIQASKNLWSNGQQFPKLPTISMNMPKQVFSTKAKIPGIIQASKNLWSKPFPAISMMMQQRRHTGRMTQSRDLFTRAPNVASLGFIWRATGSEGVLRPDIMQHLANCT